MVQCSETARHGFGAVHCFGDLPRHAGGAGLAVGALQVRSLSHRTLAATK